MRDTVLEGIVGVHAALGPQQVSPPDVHLVEQSHIVRVELEVPDVEVLLDPGGRD